MWIVCVIRTMEELPVMPQSFADVEILDDGVQAEPVEQLVDPSEYLADIPRTLTSGVLGLAAFMLACFVGLLAGNPGYVILVRAMVAMVICVLIGRVLGAIGEVCIREYVTKYKSDRPRPRKPEQLRKLEAELREIDRAAEHMKKTG
jgi:hypothetical protein